MEVAAERISTQNERTEKMNTQGSNGDLIQKFFRVYIPNFTEDDMVRCLSQNSEQSRSVFARSCLFFSEFKMIKILKHFSFTKKICGLGCVLCDKSTGSMICF